MSGVAGIFARDERPVESREITPIMDRLAHRGPDGAKLWIEGAVALGHQTLWNTPEAVKESLPFARSDGPFAITADARIDNRDELLSALGLDDRPAAEIGDGEVILRAYQRWGEACPEYLVGDFAFALWDGTKQRFFCARDHLGAKPFVYHLSGALFAFASEALPLLVHPAVSGRLNEGRIADYLVTSLQAGDGRQTLFEDVLRLPAAHRLIVERERVRLERYWMPDPEREIHLASDHAYIEAFRELLADAVACRRRSHRDVAVAFSGGIDSAAVVAMAQTDRGGGAPIRTVSAIDPDDPTCPDTRSIRSVVGQGGDRARLLTPDDFSTIWGGLAAHVTQAASPFDAVTSGIGPTLAPFLRDTGGGVLMDGMDGDALMGTGEIVVADLLRRGAWRQARREAHALGEAYGISARRMFWQYGVRASVGLLFPNITNRLRTWYKRDRAYEAALASGVIAPAFARRVALRERLEAANQLWAIVPMTSLRARHANWLMHPNLASAFEQGDRAASRYQLEVRSPLMDKRLLEFALALPPEQKMRDGQRKWLLRRAVADLLPGEVVARSSLVERNIAPAFWRRLLSQEQAFLKERLSDPGPIEPYVEMGKVRDIFSDYERGGFDGSDIFTGVEVAVLAAWIQQHGVAV